MSATPPPRTLDDWLRLLETRHPKAIDLGLDRCRAVWQRLGSPRPAQRIFTVAGTNGKGSTVATICALLGSLGYRQGSYTTPHLLVYNERVQIDGRPVDDDALLSAFARVEAARGDIRLTYFEFGTLAAIVLLGDAGLDFAVLEVGLGGRLDAVNILDADCAVITPIGLDHQEYLGDDLDSIAREKAGVIRHAAPVVCGETAPPAPVLARAAELNAPLRRLGLEFHIDCERNACRFRMGEFSLSLPAPALRGAHQAANMATGLAAVLSLVPEAALCSADLIRGLQSVALPGRLQTLSGRPRVWVDVGHNPLAAAAVASALRADVAGGQTRCVLAMLADKDVRGVVEHLDPEVSAWYCAGLGGARGQTGRQLARRLGLPRDGIVPVVCASVAEAFEAALADSAEADRVLVFGSFQTAGQALDYWRVARDKVLFPIEPPA